ncbi:ribosomal protein L9, N- domain protein [Trichinella spiralis]|uniref:ribosomal protein L9, N- domain protein n=1 Tax=Trichinella spiralis TaxID=6334 RepID=UPI0001EFD4F9|nr:ribosomal protein L9, N- domain protein [Trichinella spiralis]
MHSLLRLFDRMSTNFRTFVRHAHYFPATVAGREQRSPDEKEQFQHYEVIQEDGDGSRPDVAVILTQDVEGYGKAGEVITVSSEILHNELLPLKLAVYPTKFNRRLYNITDEQMSKRGQKKLSFELRTSKELHSMVVIVNMSLDNEWTLEKWHLRVSMRLQGFMVPDDCIVLPLHRIVGPNLDLEAKLFRFYVVVVLNFADNYANFHSNNAGEQAHCRADGRSNSASQQQDGQKVDHARLGSARCQ